MKLIGRLKGSYGSCCLVVFEVLTVIALIIDATPSISQQTETMDSQSKSIEIKWLSDLSELSKSEVPCSSGHYECVFDLARKQIEKIKHPVSKANAIRDLTLCLAESGLHQQALNAAESLADDRFFAESFASVAASAYEAGLHNKASELFERARESARGQDNSLNRARSYVAVAFFEDSSIGRASAIKTLEKGLNELMRNDPRSELVKPSGKTLVIGPMDKSGSRETLVLDDVDDLAATIARLTDRADIDSIRKDLLAAENRSKIRSINEGLREIAAAMSYLGEDARAQIIALSILEKQIRNTSLQRIVLAQVHRNRLEAAIETATLLEGQPSASWAWAEIIGAQARNGDIEGAKRTFELNEFGIYQPIAEAALGAVIKRNSNQKYGEEWLDRARVSVIKSKDTLRPWLWQEVAIFVALSGDSTAALNTLKSVFREFIISKNFNKQFEIERFSHTMSSVGSDNAAVSVLLNSQENQSYFGGVGRLSARLAAKGNFIEAITLASSLLEGEDLAGAFSAIGTASASPEKVLSVRLLPDRVPASWIRVLFGLPPIN